jgi:[ribosomal protein S5]-alanine N-acetyltransferase
MKLPHLRTERLVLRPFETADATRVQELAGVRDVALNTMNIPHPYPPGAGQQWVASQEEKLAQGHHNFAIDDGALVGGIGLRVQSEYERAEIGYWIGKPFWGRGYATEAAAAIIRYGFEELNLRRIYAGYFSRNEKSARIMIKNGMKYEGTLRQHVKKWDEFVDVVYYGMLKEEWSS